jgi:small-conductance mechanosensitive channel
LNPTFVSDPSELLRVVQLERVPFALLAIAIAWGLTTTVARVLDDLGARFTGWRILLKQITVVLKFLVLVGTTGVVVANLVQLTDEVLLAVGGSVAFAVGFALKDLVTSFMAGVTILFDRPFQVGDRVTVGDIYGEVVEIGLRTTRIVTLNDSHVSVPNSRFLTDTVSSANAGELDQLCVIAFYVSSLTELNLARRIVYEATISSRFVFLQKPVKVYIREAPVPGMETMIALHLTVKAYVMDGRFEVAFDTDVHERVKRAFREAGIETPGDLIVAKLRRDAAKADGLAPYSIR